MSMGTYYVKGLAISLLPTSAWNNKALVEERIPSQHDQTSPKKTVEL